MLDLEPKKEMKIALPAMGGVNANGDSFPEISFGVDFGKGKSHSACTVGSVNPLTMGDLKRVNDLMKSASPPMIAPLMPYEYDSKPLQIDNDLQIDKLGDIRFYTNEDGNQELIQMMGSGSMGIGTLSPGSILHLFDEEPTLERDPDLDDVGHEIIAKAW